jgi:hypothetical protein
MHYLAVSIDVFHALVMMFWIIGLPLLFWHKFPKLTIYYCFFGILFVIVNQISHYTLGECILTTLSKWCWNHTEANHPSTQEWFSVRFANFIFGLTPSHRDIKVFSEIIILISIVGNLYLFYKQKLILQKAL